MLLCPVEFQIWYLSMEKYMPLNILLIVFVTCNRLNGVLIQKNEGKKIKNLNDHFMLLMWQGINIDMKNSFSCGCQICKFQTNW